MATVEDKAAFRRAQVARASRALRDRRRVESRSLREENDRLHAERSAYVDQIRQLQAEIAQGCDPDEERRIELEAENAMLRFQVEQNSLFLVSILASAEATEPGSDPDRLNREIAEQTLENARLVAMRCLTPFASMEGCVPRLVIDTHNDFARTVVTGRIAGDDVYIRGDSVLYYDDGHANVTARSVREALTRGWEDREEFEKMYMNLKPFATFDVAVAPNFCWDSIDDADTTIRTQYVGESSDEGSTDWVFLASMSERVMPYSLLWPTDPSVAETLFPNTGDQSPRGSSKKKAKVPAEHERHGEARVWVAMRTVTCHFEPAIPSSNKASAERVVDDFVEMFLVWEEDVNGKKAVRAVVAMVGKTTLKLPPLGRIFAEMKRSRTFPDDLQLAFLKFHTRVVDIATEEII